MPWHLTPLVYRSIRLAMPKVPTIIRRFATERKVDISGWAVTETETHIIMAASIPDRVLAYQLVEFLEVRGLTCTVSMGDKRATTWSLMARSANGEAASLERRRYCKGNGCRRSRK
jgi:hypothetical protein